MQGSLVIMGVAGSGKSSFGAAVAEARALRLIEGDAFHSEANVLKMQRGTALTDADRQGWLATLCEELQRRRESVVLTCSALRRVYREQLRAASPGLRFAFLEIGPQTALDRVQARAAGHFFNANLVASQFATLEPPLGEPGVLQLDATAPLPELLGQLDAWWCEEQTR
jgi:gluconokinase